MRNSNLKIIRQIEVVLQFSALILPILRIFQVKLQFDDFFLFFKNTV